jgi:heme exporter protein B
MKQYLRALFTITWKDLKIEWRSHELISAMLVFALLTIFIFNFALDLDVQTRNNVTAGVLWVTFSFSGTLGLNRALAVEKDRGCMDGLLLAPVDHTAIYFGKLIASLMMMLVVAAIVLPLYSLLYNINLFNPGLILVIILGSLGYSSVGILLAGMAVQTRTRDILLPIVLFPVVLPVVIAAVKASSGFLDALPINDIRFYIDLLLVYDVIFIATGLMTFNYIIED